MQLNALHIYSWHYIQECDNWYEPGHVSAPVFHFIEMSQEEKRQQTVDRIVMSEDRFEYEYVDENVNVVEMPFRFLLHYFSYTFILGSLVDCLPHILQGHVSDSDINFHFKSKFVGSFMNVLQLCMKTLLFPDFIVYIGPGKEGYTRYGHFKHFGQKIKIGTKSSFNLFIFRLKKRSLAMFWFFALFLL